MCVFIGYCKLCEEDVFKSKSMIDFHRKSIEHYRESHKNVHIDTKLINIRMGDE